MQSWFIASKRRLKTKMLLSWLQSTALLQPTSIDLHSDQTRGQRRRHLPHPHQDLIGLLCQDKDHPSKTNWGGQAMADHQLEDRLQAKDILKMVYLMQAILRDHLLQDPNSPTQPKDPDHRVARDHLQEESRLPGLIPIPTLAMS